MSKRRPYGTGSLIESDAAWYGQWRVGGRLVKRKLGAKKRAGASAGISRKEAEAKLRDLIQATKPTSLGTETVADIAGRYLEHLEHVLQRKATTLQDYRSILSRHVEPFFHDRPIVGVTLRDLDAYVARKRAAGLANKTVRNHVMFLNGIFGFAVKRGVIDANVVARLDRPRSAEETDIRYLSMAELERLLAALLSDTVFGASDEVLVLTAATTGLRQGEILALRWRDVDREARVVRVRRSVTRGRVGSPKSRSSSRAVPMGTRVAAALAQHRTNSPWGSDDDLVFPHPLTGAILDPSRLRRRFAVALVAAGVRSIRFHDLRHTYGTLMASAGTPLRLLQGWMGHRDYKTTSIYADFAPDPTRGGELTDEAFGS